MPNYNFVNTDTGEEFEEFFTISGREEFLKDNPNIQQLPSLFALSASGTGDRIKNDNGWKENMSEDEAKALLETCMRTLYYRDCRTINRISFAKITATETVVSDPVCMETKWDFASFVRPKAGADSDGSW